MGTTKRTAKRRPGVVLGAAAVSLALIAGACSKKDDSTTAKPPASSTAGSTASTASSTASSPVGTNPSTDTSVVGTTPATATTVPAKDPVKGGTLLVSGDAEVAQAWTPAAMQCDSYCSERARTFFDPLVAIGSDNKVHPYLVESWKPNADFSAWTFTLRKGITFTDGTPVNAAAVSRNLKDSAAGLLLAKAFLSVAKEADGSLLVEIKDPLTFTLYTGKNGDKNSPISFPDLPRGLAGQLGLIASPKWLDEVKLDPAKATQPVGSGPFTVASYAPGDKLVVKRNPSYWQKDAKGNQLPYLDGIEFRVIEDSENAGKALQSGDIDVFSTSTAVVISDFRSKTDQFPMIEQSKFTETNYLLIDLEKTGPLSDRRVRCALSMAINRKELGDATTAGILQPANGLFSPGQQGYLADNGFSTEQNVDGAKKLIAEYQAEHPGPVTFVYGTTNTQINAQSAELLLGYWSAIGVNATVQQIPQDAFITTALFGKPEFQMFGWRQHGGTTVNDQYIWWHSSIAGKDGELSLNFARLRDPEIDKNLDLARTSSDPAEQQKAAEDINRRMASQCYSIPTAWTLWGTPHKKKVQGFNTTQMPDGSGTTTQDGAGFPGQFWMNSIWIDPSA